MAEILTSERRKVQLQQGRILLPKDMLQRLGLDENGQCEITLMGNEIKISAPSGDFKDRGQAVRVIIGHLRDRSKPVRSIEDMARDSGDDDD